jgi:hypothetical protein
VLWHRPPQCSFPARQRPKNTLQRRLSNGSSTTISLFLPWPTQSPDLNPIEHCSLS